jgi:hypothetical protein
MQREKKKKGDMKILYVLSLITPFFLFVFLFGLFSYFYFLFIANIFIEFTLLCNLNLAWIFFILFKVLVFTMKCNKRERKMKWYI